MYVQRNEAFKKPLLPWKIGITYSECVFVALLIHHATHMRHIAICGLPRSTIFFPHYLIKGSILDKSYSTQNVRFDYLYEFV